MSFRAVCIFYSSQHFGFFYAYVVFGHIVVHASAASGNSSDFVNNVLPFNHFTKYGIAPNYIVPMALGYGREILLNAKFEF